MTEKLNQTFPPIVNKVKMGQNVLNNYIFFKIQFSDAGEWAAQD